MKLTSCPEMNQCVSHTSWCDTEQYVQNGGNAKSHSIRAALNKRNQNKILGIITNGKYKMILKTADKEKN